MCCSPTQPPGSAAIRRAVRRVPQPDIARHRRGHRGTAALRVSCDAEAADAAGERAHDWDDVVAAAADARRSYRAVRSAAAGGAGRVRLPRAARDRRQCAAAGTGRCLRRAPRSVPRAAIRGRACTPAARRSHPTAGRDAGALGLSLRVRHLVLPHDTDAPAECGGEADVHAGRRDIFRPRDRHTAPGRPTSACSFSQRPAHRSSSRSVCSCAVERGNEARHAVLQRAVVHHRFHRHMVRHRDAARQP